MQRLIKRKDGMSLLEHYSHMKEERLLNPIAIVDTSFRRVFRGYDVEQVDEHIRQCGEAYSKLFKKYLEKCSEYEELLKRSSQESVSNIRKEQMFTAGSDSFTKKKPEKYSNTSKTFDEIERIKEYLQILERHHVLEEEVRELETRALSLEEEIRKQQQEIRKLEERKRELIAVLKGIQTSLDSIAGLGEDVDEQQKDEHA